MGKNLVIELFILPYFLRYIGFTIYPAIGIIMYIMSAVIVKEEMFAHWLLILGFHSSTYFVTVHQWPVCHCSDLYCIHEIWWNPSCADIMIIALWWVLYIIKETQVPLNIRCDSFSLNKINSEHIYIYILEIFYSIH
jgi:hypothetical protein